MTKHTQPIEVGTKIRLTRALPVGPVLGTTGEVVELYLSPRSDDLYVCRLDGFTSLYEDGCYRLNTDHFEVIPEPVGLRLAPGTPIRTLEAFAELSSGSGRAVPAGARGVVVEGGGVEVWPARDPMHFVHLPGFASPASHGNWLIKRSEMEPEELVFEFRYEGDMAAAVLRDYLGDDPEPFVSAPEDLPIQEFYAKYNGDTPPTAFDRYLSIVGEKMDKLVLDHEPAREGWEESHRDWLNDLDDDTDDYEEWEGDDKTIEEDPLIDDPRRGIPTPKITLELTNLTSVELNAVDDIEETLVAHFGAWTECVLRRDVDSYSARLTWE